jgi:hypothetical protein
MAVRHPAEHHHQHRLAERENRDQTGSAGIVEPFGQAVQRQQALQRRLADAGKERRLRSRGRRA